MARSHPCGVPVGAEPVRLLRGVRDLAALHRARSKHTVDELVAAQEAGYSTAFSSTTTQRPTSPRSKTPPRSDEARVRAHLVTQIRADAVFTKDAARQGAAQAVETRRQRDVVCIGSSRPTMPISSDSTKASTVRACQGAQGDATPWPARARMFIALAEDTEMS